MSTSRPFHLIRNDFQGAERRYKDLMHIRHLLCQAMEICDESVLTRVSTSFNTTFDIVIAEAERASAEMIRFEDELSRAQTALTSNLRYYLSTFSAPHDIRHGQTESARASLALLLGAALGEQTLSAQDLLPRLAPREHAFLDAMMPFLVPRADLAQVGTEAEALTVAVRAYSQEAMVITSEASLRTVLDGIQFEASGVNLHNMNLQWEVESLGTGWRVRHTFNRPDRETGETGRGGGRWELVEMGTSESSVVKTCWVLLTLLVTHELMESFKYRGVRVFDPHKTVHDLALPGMLR